MKPHFALVIVVVVSTLFQAGIKGEKYENCSKKLRQLILDSCNEPKNKRSAVFERHGFNMHSPHLPQDRSQQVTSSVLLGKILGVPSQWTEEELSSHQINKQFRRNNQSVRNLIIECCVDGCTPNQIMGLCD